MGSNCDEICNHLNITVNIESKSFIRTVSNRMLDYAGIDTNTIVVKTIRMDEKHRCTESMSFPVFKYKEIAKQEWEDSDLFLTINKPFLFMCFMNNTDRHLVTYLGAIRFEFDDEMRRSAENVWNDTKFKIERGDYGNFQHEKTTDMIFVRTHGRDSRDIIETPEGGKQVKRSFWISKKFIESNIISRLDL